MNRFYKVGLSIVRTLILLGMGTGACYRELFLEDDPNYVIIMIGLGMILGEGVITAWILSRFTITGTDTPSLPVQPLPQQPE